MLRRLALTGDVSESSRYAEEECASEEDPVDETELDVGFRVARLVGAIGVLVDTRRRFGTGESCVVGIKLLPTVLCTCEWHPSENTN